MLTAALIFCQNANFVYRILIEFINRHHWKYLSFCVTYIAFSVVQLCYETCIVCNIKIAIFISVKYLSCRSVNIRSYRNLNINNCFTINLIFFKLCIKCRADFIRIIHLRNKVFLYLFNAILVNSANSSIIFYTQKQISAQSVKHRTNRLKCVFIKFSL